ncbi:hypothetical protein ACM1PE_29360 [Achromobacter sp. PD1]|uniref:hypothetical protein n=2 Tax=unclassified Achromobacter TaxID=2626865 RepID=UPI003AF5A611
MRGFMNAARLGLLMACAWTLSAAAQTRPDPAPSQDPAVLGRALLDAGPDARVRLDGQSLDHATMFGTEDANEQALLDQERAIAQRREQMRVLEKLLSEKPAADPHPPAMIPLKPGVDMTMPSLAPAPSGSQLNRGTLDTRRSLDDMQRRVDALRREADTLSQRGR